MSGYVGLAIGNVPEDGKCGAISPMNGQACVLPTGHEGQHSAPGAASGTPPACPDCGGPMAEFKVDAPTEEMAMRVFLSYYAAQVFSPQDLQDIVDGKKHLHLADGSGCTE